MSRTITVFLGEEARLVGRLHYDVAGRRESAAFEYDATWLASAERYALDPSLPLVTGAQFHRRIEHGSVFHSAFADTEPDGWGQRVIRRDHAKRRQEARRTGGEAPAAQLHAIDFLLAVDDRSRVGALRLQDESRRFQRAAEEGRRTAPPLLELGHLLAATRAVEANAETLADLDYLRGRGTSLGGMRPKCTVIDDDGRLSIGKFPSKDDERAVTKGEILALHLADRAGIDVAKSRLIDSGGTPVALIRRFDRTADHLRLAYVSAATLMGIERGDPAEHTYTDLADTIRTHGAAAQNDLDELWRRMAFSVLINNVDDHLHNHGFLHAERGLWRLAPAFDINPFPDRVRELKTWISEEAGPGATVENLLSVAPYFRIPRPRAKAILREVEAAVAQWRAVATGLGLSTIEQDQFEEAFEHPERAAARNA